MFESSSLLRNEVYTAWKSKDRRKVQTRSVHKGTRNPDLEMSIMQKKTRRISHEHKCYCEDSLKGIATPHLNPKPCTTTWRHKPITSSHPKPQQSSPTASPPEPFVHAHLPKQIIRACKASRLSLTSHIPTPSPPLCPSPHSLSPNQSVFSLSVSLSRSLLLSVSLFPLC